MSLQQELIFKDLGMTQSAEKHYKELRQAKEMALFLARTRGVISVNDVREALPHLDFSGNWTGSIFKGKSFQFTGTYEPARHKGGHARDVKRWKLAA